MIISLVTHQSFKIQLNMFIDFFLALKTYHQHQSASHVTVIDELHNSAAGFNNSFYQGRHR